MGQLDLSVFILQEKRLGALEHAQGTTLETRGMPVGNDALAARLHADHPHRGIFEEGIEQSDGIRTPAHAGHEQVGQAALLFLNLPARLIADDPLKIPHHERIGMRPRRRSRGCSACCERG